MKKILSIALSLLIFCSVGVKASDITHGAYGVLANTNYSNPDTGIIDDNGSDDALGGAMSRSCTATTALVEKDGDKYYVTIRLLLQSSTNDAKFWERTGYNTYSATNYEMIAENAVADSIDYRFEVANPFAPIKVSMYVVPMGRDVVWFVELDESTVSADTGDFIVTVKAVETLETEVAQTESVELEQETEIVLEVEETQTTQEEVLEQTEIIEDETASEEILQDEVIEDDIIEEVEAESSEQTDYITEDTDPEVLEAKTSSNLPMILGITAVAIVGVVGFIFGKKRGK